MTRKKYRDFPMHLVIPDTQCKPGVDLRHMLWTGFYIRRKRPDVIVHLGDHWDMPSLSSYDRGTKRAEGRRYVHDIAAGNYAMQLLLDQFADMPDYKPLMVFCIGNHEERILRHAEAHPELAGTLTYDSLNLSAWQVADYLTIKKVHGVAYTHFITHPMTGKPLGGNAQRRLVNVGYSFTMGHQQGKDQAERWLSDGTVQRCLIAGSCYIHDESYKGPQGNRHWRGVVVKHEVRRGNYDLMEVSLGFLQRHYERHARKPRRSAIKYQPRRQSAK
jgi:hypothetical protein